MHEEIAAMAHDVVLAGGLVIDPSQDLATRTDVAFLNGRVADIGPRLHGRAEIDVSGCIVMPGLIDLHTHLYEG